MKLNLLSTNKKHNSFGVVQPLNSPIECYLKESTSIIRPIFILENASNLIKLGYNYLYCVDWGRYYFINNITISHNNYYELECEIDVLASYRNDILSQTFFIERASTGYNEKIVDNLVTSLADFETTSSTLFLDFFNDEGSYFISSASSSTMSTMWNINETYLNTLADELMTDTGFVDEMQKYYNQPMNAIYSMHWLPFAVGSFGGTYLNVEFANWSSDIVQGYRISNTTITKEFSITIPKPYTDFRLLSACTYMLYLPCCQPIKIENSFIEPSDSLYIKYIVDCADGNVIARIYTLENGFIAKTSGNLKTDRAVASVTSNALSIGMGVGTGLGSLAGGVLTLNPVMMASGLLSTVSAVSIPPQVSATGNYGGRGAYVSDNKQAILSCTYSSTIEPNSIVSTSGRPVMKNGTLSNYSDFVKCDNASVELYATGEEIELVNNLLNGGVFIE